MSDTNKGKPSLKFGVAERKLSLNWASLGISIAVAVLTWFGAEAVPQLEEHGGAYASLAGLVAQIIPILVIYLRSNKDVVVEKSIPLQKEN